MQASPTPISARRSIPKGATCGDCYFRRQGLCALALEKPCPTFRAAVLGLEPPHQARLVPRAAFAAA